MSQFGAVHWRIRGVASGNCVYFHNFKRFIKFYRTFWFFKLFFNFGFWFFQPPSRKSLSAFALPCGQIARVVEGPAQIAIALSAAIWLLGKAVVFGLERTVECVILQPFPTRHWSQFSPVTSLLHVQVPLYLLHPSLLYVPSRLHLQAMQPSSFSAVKFQNPFLQRSHLRNYVLWTFASRLPRSIHIGLAIAFSCDQASLRVFLSFADSLKN